MNSNKKFLLGLSLGLSLLSTAAAAQKVTVHALSYQHEAARGRLLYTLRNFTVVTTSDKPGHTFTLENDNSYLVPGSTYTGEWQKHGKKLKVQVYDSYYLFGKKTLTTITFKVVGEGILP